MILSWTSGIPWEVEFFISGSAVVLAALSLSSALTILYRLAFIFRCPSVDLWRKTILNSDCNIIVALHSLFLPIFFAVFWKMKKANSNGRREKCGK